jgi:SNF2 family DNA or RNA helicase
MTQFQIDYYQHLPDDKKDILKKAALKADSIYEYNIVELIFPKKITHKYIREVLDEAVEHSLFRNQKNYRNEYVVELDFMLYVYPELLGLEAEWVKITKNHQHAYYNNSFIGQFRDCLYSLLHEPKEYPKHESVFFQRFTQEKLNCYVELILRKEYENKLRLIRSDLMDMALSSAINAKLNALASLSETKHFFEHVKQLANHEHTIDSKFIDKEIALMSGNFGEAIGIVDKTDVMWINAVEAISKVTQGNAGEAFVLFEKALKIQRQTYRDAQAPVALHIAVYYFATLMNIDPKTSTPVFRKIEQWINKNGVTGSLFIFSVIAYHVLNMKENEASELATLADRILNITPGSEYLKLSALLAYSMTGQQGKSLTPEAVLPVVEKACASGYDILAYEAAYVAKSWFNDERSNELYRKMASKLSYPPVLSRITHQEDWEKSVNLLLGLKVAASKTTKDGESKTRVVYFFNPGNKSIQPVLQTRQAKGWTTGRNIAMKSFFECKTQGMTAQDLRIAKTIKCYKDYYSEYYEFTKDVYAQLTGHPYIFLENSANVPVEFVAAQPIVTVAKSAKGYTLSTDMKDASEKISIRKETNTRYLVYDLAPQQMNILQIVSKQSIVVPERGKEKLIELLGNFSAQGLNVHSDLLASGGEQTQVKEIPADSRIRVQLLPFGDGLKAELFSKPFGEHPPYCKPGKGGKVLIANEKDVQLQVKRDIKKELEHERILLNEIQSLESIDMTDDLITFTDPLDSLSMLDILTKYQDISVVEWPEGERFRIRGRAGFGNLSVKLQSGINWFELQGELKVDENTVVSLQQLLALTEKSHHQFVELKPGEFLALSNELKKQLDELRLFSTVGKNEVKINKFASVALDDFFDSVEHLNADKSWKKFRERVSNVKINDVAVPAHLEAELRAYQEEGFQWLARLAEWEGGACLADDMGLGKTVQTLAVLLHRAQQGPAMVVCPVSVIGNWISETERFAPTLQVKTFGSAAGNRKELLESLEAGDLLVTSYGLLQSENELLSEHSFATIVLDEAHAIKNYATKTSKATMQLKAAFRVALTGTPIQNHLGEIWNIFNFINPGLLGSLQHFTDTFIKPDNEKTRKYLKKLIAPFILRRTKTAVLDELPPKTEIVKKIELSGEERTFYEALRRKAIENLNSSDMNNGAKHLQVLAEITKLRQASCHPQLIDPNIRISSSKLSTFLEIVNELRENKHRALVFSQFVSHLAIVRKALDEQGVRYQYLDGSSPIADRVQSVKKFQNGEGELFLISLKAGGLGLNLTAADFVIHLDPWWNPAVEDQASDRAHRIGQTRPVTIYRLVAENTIEEKIIQLHHTKRDLAESLLEGSDRSARLSLTELVALIKDRE